MTTSAVFPNAGGLILAAVALLNLLSSCESRTIDSVNLHDNSKDPLIAIATDPQMQHVAYSQVYQSQIELTPSNQYPAVPANPNEIQYEQREAQPELQPGQYLPRQSVQYVQVVHEHEHYDPNCNQKQEYVQPQLTEPARDYPGQVLYIGQNSEVLNSAPETDTGASTQMLSSQQGPLELDGVVSTISRHAGMPATILTEIPVNEMPSDVLDRLRRDFGVKVVATRERPGANLVINCDDYSHQESSICSRQPRVASAHPGMGPNVMPAYSYAAPNEEDPSYTMSVQPIQPQEQQLGQPIAYTNAVESSGAQADQRETMYSTDPAVAAHQTGGEQHQSSESQFGARHSGNRLAPEAEPAVSRNEHHELEPHGAQNELNQSGEQTSEQNHHQNSGFDEQPKSVEEATKQGGEYYSGRQ